MVQMNVKKWTYDKLKEIKEREDHSSFDSVIRTLIQRNESYWYSTPVRNKLREFLEKELPKIKGGDKSVEKAD